MSTFCARPYRTDFAFACPLVVGLYTAHLTLYFAMAVYNTRATDKPICRASLGRLTTCKARYMLTHTVGLKKQNKCALSAILGNIIRASVF